jgi:D-alanine transaminase
MTQTVYLNGEYLPIDQAKVSVLDRGFIFGDGVYEVIPVYGKVPFRMEGHLVRMQRSMDEIKLRNPFTDAEWAKLVQSLVDRHEWADQAVYIQVTRGVAPRDHRMPKDLAPTIFMMTNALVRPSENDRRNGVAAVSMQDNRWLRCHIKSTSLLGNVMLRQAAADAGCIECVLFRDGQLTEASASNVFAVKNGVLLAPTKDNLILAGITYDAVIDLAREHGMPVEVRTVSEAEVRNADELWLTSSSKEVLAIVSLDGKPVGSGKPGPMFERMAAWYEAAKRTPAERPKAATHA